MIVSRRQVARVLGDVDPEGAYARRRRTLRRREYWVRRCAPPPPSLVPSSFLFPPFLLSRCFPLTHFPLLRLIIFQVAGPLSLWHLDGHEKLFMWGFYVRTTSFSPASLLPFPLLLCLAHMTDVPAPLASRRPCPLTFRFTVAWMATRGKLCSSR